VCSSDLACRLVARRIDAALAKALGAWQLTADDSGLVWTGEVAGPDRLRFIGILSRYVALIADLSLSEKTGAGAA
jgi:ABC-2 type transport system ATP-binding protein